MIPAFVDSLPKTNRNRVQSAREVVSVEVEVEGSLKMTSSVVGRRSSVGRSLIIANTIIIKSIQIKSILSSAWGCAPIRRGAIC